MLFTLKVKYFRLSHWGYWGRKAKEPVDTLLVLEGAPAADEVNLNFVEETNGFIN